MKEDVIPNFTNDFHNLVAGVNIKNSSTTNSSGKRKAREQYGMQSRKKIKKPSGVCDRLLSRVDELFDHVSTKNDSRDKIGCSVNEVMAEVHSIPGITFGDDLYCFATKYLSKRTKGEMWASIGDIDRKYRWLQKMY